MKFIFLLLIIITTCYTDVTFSEDSIYVPISVNIDATLQASSLHGNNPGDPISFELKAGEPDTIVLPFANYTTNVLTNHNTASDAVEMQMTGNTISLSLPNAFQKGDLNIYSLSGRKLAHMKLDNSVNTLYSYSISAGIYILTISDPDNYTYTEKINLFGNDLIISTQFNTALRPTRETISVRSTTNETTEYHLSVVPSKNWFSDSSFTQSFNPQMNPTLELELIQTAMDPAIAEIHRSPIHFNFKPSLWTEQEVLDALDSNWGPGNYPTQMSPVWLNSDPSKRHEFILELKKRVPNLFFGVGNGRGALDSPNREVTTFPDQYDWFIEMAAKILPYSDCIRIENFSGILDFSEEIHQDGYVTAELYMDSLLNELHAMGFNHIMLNPWRARKVNQEKKWPHVDSNFESASPDMTNSDRRLPYKKINAFQEEHPFAPVIVNYESTGGHILLSDAEIANPGSIYDTTSQYNMAWLAHRQELKDNLGSADTLVGYFKWAAPWTGSFNAIELNALPWIANRMIELNN